MSRVVCRSPLRKFWFIMPWNTIKNSIKWGVSRSKNIWFAIENAVKDPSLIRIADNEPMTTETHAVAYFINVMGEAVGAEYGAEETSASDGNVEKLFQYLTTIGLGYSNISLSAIDANKVREMIFIKKLPFYFSGRSNTSGHAWVISGWLLRTRTATHRYANAPTQSQTEREQYVYCNFGWDRYYNGYYKFNVFNAAGGPELRTSSTDNYYYRNNLRAVTYDLTR